VAVNKLTWQQAGQVTEPGRYMFRFGWLTITSEDLAVWKQFPDASFVLVKKPSPTSTDDTDEYRLGVFDVKEHSLPGEN
jgi:hypothetical protein